MCVLYLLVIVSVLLLFDLSEMCQLGDADIETGCSLVRQCNLFGRFIFLSCWCHFMRHPAAVAAATSDVFLKHRASTPGLHEAVAVYHNSNPERD